MKSKAHIEIGGGNSPSKEGYTQVDIRKFSCTDIVAPAWKLPIPRDSILSIFGRHVLEHFTRQQASDALCEWHRVLRVSGEIIMTVPDLEYHARQLLNNPDGPSPRLPEHTNREHAMAGFYGWAPGAMAHQWGYTETTLQR